MAVATSNSTSTSHQSHYLTPFINQLHPINSTNINTHSILRQPYTMLSTFNAATSRILLQLRTSYILPALFLNPAFIVHCVNTYVSRHTYDSATFPPSASPYQFFENLGPVTNAPVLFDAHEHDGLLWIYTVLSVFMQIWAFGKITKERELAKRNGDMGGRNGLLGVSWESKTARESGKAS